MAYEVSTPVFEGPFDLLLHLITSDEVDVYEVSLSKIVDSFLVELGKLAGSLDLETATQFALIAATLIQLKCRRLLPVREEVELDEELEMWEERDLLLSKLLEFSAFKDVAAMLRTAMELAARSLPRLAGMEERFFDVAPDLLEGVSPDKLRTAMLRVLTPKPEPQVTLDHVTAVTISVAEMVKLVAGRLSREGSATFRELTSGMSERIEVVVAFLAVLELYKQDLVDLDQLVRFGEIRVVWNASPDGGDEVDLDSIEVSTELSDAAVARARSAQRASAEGAVEKDMVSVSEEYNG